MLTIIGAIIIFSVIIFVHEFGHFITARMFGVTVHEFAMGMGPVLWKKQGKETLYSIRAIPMGGFCQMEGEDEESDAPGAFNNKKPWKRFIILVAGAGMNVLLGFVILLCLVTTSAVTNNGIASVVVDSVMPELQEVDFLQPGDKITAINGSKVNIKRDISFELAQNGEKEAEITFTRNGENITKTFTPMIKTNKDGKEYYLVGFNVKIDDISIGGVLRETFFQTVWMVKIIFVSLGMLFSGKAALSDLSGPVGVVSAMNTVAKNGLLEFLFFAAFLAVNIGVMNLLPIPALDGGRTLFVIFEIIFRKPIPRDKEGIIHFVGFALLILLMLYATYNDIVRIFKA